VFRLDKTTVNQADARRYSDNKTYWRASDITTLVSSVLVVARLVANSLAGILAWMCAFILLEKSSLDLLQFNRMVSLRVPWPPSIGSGWYSLIVTIALLLMLPSTLVTPLLSGAVDWKNVHVQVDAGNVTITSAIFENDNWLWYQNHQDVRAKMADRAVGLAGLAWSNIEHRDDQGCRHVVPQNGNLPVNSTVVDATIPCIQFHEISWYKSSLPQHIREVLESPTNVSLTGDLFDTLYLGNAFAFDSGRWSNGSNTDFPAPSRFSGEKTVVIVVSMESFDSAKKCSLLPGLESMFGIIANSTMRAYPAMVAIYDRCAMVGTINFTAGVIHSPESTYVSHRAIEANAVAENQIVADRWVTEALYLMPDVMSKISLANTTSLATWGNLDGYAESLVRQ